MPIYFFAFGSLEAKLLMIFYVNIKTLEIKNIKLELFSKNKN